MFVMDRSLIVRIVARIVSGRGSGGCIFTKADLRDVLATTETIDGSEST